MPQADIEKIREYAYKLLSARAYSVAILRDKLNQKFKDSEEETDKILKRMQELGYLNDQTYAKNFIEFRGSTKPSGKFKLRQELIRKKISEDDFKDYLEEIDETKLAKDALNQKIKTLHEKDARKKKEKLMRFLASRGFNYDNIKTALEDIEI